MEGGRTPNVEPLPVHVPIAGDGGAGVLVVVVVATGGGHALSLPDLSRAMIHCLPQARRGEERR